MNSSPVTPSPVPTIIVDHRITLSQITWADRAAHLKYLNATSAISQVLKSIQFPYTQSDADTWLRTVTARIWSADAKEVDWAIRQTNGELIGEIWLVNILRGIRAEIGYWLAQEFWGQGITPLAVQAVTHHAFDAYELRKVYATVRDGNVASRRVLEKAGYAFEATLRSHTVHDGQSYDVHWYGCWR